MHANLNTILYFMIWFCLFYDLVLLIECSYWISSPSFPCARQFGVMHSGMKGGATITDGRICTPHELRVFKKKTRQTDSQPVMNNNDLI